MPADDSGPADDLGDEETSLRRAVGDELRHVIDTLLSHRAPPDGLEEARRLIEQARLALGGPDLGRYQQAPGFWAEGGTSSRGWDAYIDTSVFGGGTNPLGMPMDIEYGRDTDDVVYAAGTVTLGRPYEGGPGMVHGGYVAGLIDHLFGAAMHAVPVTAVTASLTVRFVAPTPVHRPLHFRAWFDQPRGRRLNGRATCHAGDTLTAESEGLFVIVDMTDMAQRVKGA
ncbi:MAG: PaaI family thioesterase [Acidimicrobiales bacterium]